MYLRVFVDAQQTEWQVAQNYENKNIVLPNLFETITGNLWQVEGELTGDLS